MANRQIARWISLTILLDLGLTIAALVLARWLREIFPGPFYLGESFAFKEMAGPLHFSLPTFLPIVLVVWFAVFAALSVYDTSYFLNKFDHTQTILTAVTGSILIFAGIAYLFFRNLSRFLFFYFYILDLLFLIGWRKIITGLIRNGRWSALRVRQRILFVGDEQRGQEIAASFAANSWVAKEIVGKLPEMPDPDRFANTVANKVIDLQVDEIIFALSPGHKPFLQKIVYQLQPQSVNIRILPDIMDIVYLRATIEDVPGLPLINLRQPALPVLNRALKRTFDIIVSASLLILSSPLSLVILTLVKLDSPGSAFFSSQRVGEGGKTFSMYKFRTMKADANTKEIDLLRQDDEILGLNKNPDDPRITKIGRILRGTSLDELPQLINVLRGEMSLVGPRPELPWLVERYEPWQHLRFAVPQGMTGWWQVKNRGNQQAYDIRIDDDLYYIHNYSFWLDLRILWLTLGAIIRRDGAY